MAAYIPDVQKLADNQDISGLINALRYPDSVTVRAEAAQALGELSDDQAVESLARSVMEDPASEVKRAARSALEEMYGNVADSILSSYQNAPAYSEPWIKGKSDDQVEQSEIEPTEASTASIHFDIPWLKKNKDLDGLLEALRYLDDPAGRAAAAIALGDLGYKEMAEYLVRALLEDPDQKVQSAAHQALVEMFGNEISNVIASYRQGSAYPDTWLQQAPTSLPEEFEPVQETDIVTTVPTKIELLKDNEDLEGLVEVLRSPTDPHQRVEAARALGELGDANTAEFLARAVLEDPEAEVKSTARAALDKILDSGASDLIASMRSSDEDMDTWLRPTPGLQLEPDGYDPGRVKWSAQDIGGLITVVRAERDPKMKIKAIRMLSKIGDPQAEHVLASMALWFDDALVRQAAWQALEVIHGDEAVKVIDAYRRLGAASDEGDEVGSEPDEDEPEQDNRAVEAAQPFQRTAPYKRQDPVMKEEGLGFRQALLWIGLVVIAAAAIYFFFFAH
ncbi:MAG: HEAT repeat domain-containing protein [Anaerolineaceae bacterium]|nr:HEAT repeat domain-containing protein [Anaerolineaceae bacterium]